MIQFSRSRSLQPTEPMRPTRDGGADSAATAVTIQRNASVTGYPKIRLAGAIGNNGCGIG